MDRNYSDIEWLTPTPNTLTEERYCPIIPKDTHYGHSYCMKHECALWNETFKVCGLVKKW